MALLLFGSIGAIAWAIRGTSGWGGMDGTIVPGMTWGILWYYLCSRKGIDARGIPLWLGLGISLGGELGYGQYVSWIQGIFRTDSGIVPIAPWVGFVWFAICGVGWGAPGGLMLGWALSGRVSVGRWVARLLAPAAIAYLVWQAVQGWPALFFPHYASGIYPGASDGQLARTIYTNTQNFVVLAWWAGAMLVAVVQRDRATLVAGALIGGGFGIGFPLSALWCLGYSYAPDYVDWWKIWELNAGFFLGMLYVAVLYWTIHRAPRESGLPVSPAGRWFSVLGRGVAGGLLIFIIGAEYFPMLSGGLGLGYLALMALAARQDSRRTDLGRPNSISLVFSVLLLFLILFHGVSYQLGIVLGLYTPEQIGQYGWLPARAALFVPPAIVCVGVAARTLYRVFGATPLSPSPRQAERVADLMTLIAAVGAISIWPSKIGVLYAVFLCIAMYSFNRLNLLLKGNPGFRRDA